jgi:glyoxylase-like metal-dependent hydrolase (beta-lactamase superfamily II)
MLQIKEFTFSPMAENTYVLYNDKGSACIIDPGCYFPEEFSELENFITAKELKVSLILLTHAHLDHIFGLKQVTEEYKITPMMHPKEQVVLDRGPDMGAMYGLPFPAYKGGVNYINEGDKIYLDEDALDVIYAPGHSPGHVCFYKNDQNFIIGGDVLFRQSIGRTDLPGGNHQLLIQSVKNQLFALPDNTVVHPGHGPTTTIGYEKVNNPFIN